MLSSHLYICLPFRLPPFPVPCKVVLARPDKQETCPYHFSLRLFTMVRSSCGPIVCWILAQTSSSVTWSLYEMRSILRSHLISMARILLSSSAMTVQGTIQLSKQVVPSARAVLLFFLLLQSCQSCVCRCEAGHSNREHLLGRKSTSCLLRRGATWEMEVCAKLVLHS